VRFRSIVIERGWRAAFWLFLIAAAAASAAHALIG
jgi:hypothetical protein